MGHREGGEIMYTYSQVGKVRAIILASSIQKVIQKVKLFIENYVFLHIMHALYLWPGFFLLRELVLSNCCFCSLIRSNDVVILHKEGGEIMHSHKLERPERSIFGPIYQVEYFLVMLQNYYNGR